MLQEHSDVWHVGKESVDMRISRKAFAHVQSYFPECTVMIDDLEAHVQAAEANMFPQKKAEQEAWLQTVVRAILPKVSEKNWCRFIKFVFVTGSLCTKGVSTR